jgi:hypothetical protein
MSVILSWVASSGVVQGVIIGASLAFLTTILVLDSVAKAETTTVNGWSSIRRAGQPDNGLLVRAALQKALPVVNSFEEAAYWTTSTDSAGKKLSGEHTYRLRFPPGQRIRSHQRRATYSGITMNVTGVSASRTRLISCSRVRPTRRPCDEQRHLGRQGG